MSKAIMLAASVAAILTIAGCGQLQTYHQGLTNSSNNFNRSQRLLEQQNQIEVNKLQAIQREQDIQKSRAEGEMAQAKALGDAQATIIAARAEAQANQIVARSLTPLLVQYHLIDALNDKSVIYLPSGALPLVNVQGATAK